MISSSKVGLEYVDAKSNRGSRLLLEQWKRKAALISANIVRFTFFKQTLLPTATNTCGEHMTVEFKLLQLPSISMSRTNLKDYLVMICPATA
jgi:hypothetical protein